MSALHLKSGIRDNRERGSVGEYLKKHIQPESALSIVSAYFTIYAFNHLKEHLKDINNLRFLFGEPRFLKQIDPDKTDKKSFNIEDAGLSLQNRLEQNRIARECADWIREKAEVRSIIYPNFLHGKLYHIEKNSVENAILGSSNFTVNGLGLGNSRNVELNLVVDSTRDKEDLKEWFESLWENTELVQDVKAEVLRYLSEVYAEYSPEFIYQKTLYHLFEKVLEEKGEAERQQTQMLLSQTGIWNALYGFQRVAVQSAVGKINRHGGCIIADSVGLGKTYEALAVIKYFECRNQNVLVICPKKLRENWTVYQSHAGNLLNPFPADRFNFAVLSHTDLSRESGESGSIDLSNFNWGNYDLIVIDESHNFRNNVKGRRDAEGNLIRQSRYERLMRDIIKSGVKTKVLLLSATPVNTDLKDLRNQIYLLTADDDQFFRESIGVGSVKDTLAYAQKQFNEWAEQPAAEGRDRRSLLLRLNPAFFKLLDELTIARSRRHVERYYAESVEAIGSFPRRLPPKSVYSELDLKGRFMTYDRLNDEISNYKLSIFNPSKYVRKEYRDKYLTTRVANFTQEERESHLIGMMKVNFLKRLESSINSFAVTLERTIEKIEDLERRIKLFKENQQREMFDLETLEVAGDEDEELNEAFQIGTKLKYDLHHLDLDFWLKDLQKDKQQLNLIRTQAADVSAERDGKLQDLKNLIREKVQNPPRNRDGKPNKKTLVFTAFADTAEYLYRHLRDWAREELGIHSGLVTGSGANHTTLNNRYYFNEILTNFAPVSKLRHKLAALPQTEEIDLLIATDCISEGQNLQDGDLVINYDIHWNPVRLIQRFGRIDRLGSPCEAVQLVNFWATEDLNKYLNLKNRVEARMALVDISATSSDNILLPEKIEKQAADELNYRDQQLLRLKTEILDLEDFNEAIALNDFSLDDFRAELTEQLETRRRELRDAPLGIYAVAPARDDLPPGVIFCLEQKSEIGKAEKVNPLQPFYLAYVRRDGVIVYSFVQAKQLLEAFRALCQGNNRTFEDLCRTFNVETADGSEMGFYNDLLEAAVAEIQRNFEQKNAGNLFAGRSGALLNLQTDLFKSSNFTLITWLVIV